MIIVTGGAGFIGSNLVAALNQEGITDIVVVDNLENGHKFRNLVDLQIADYWDKTDFLTAITEHKLPYKINTIFHQGACSSTTQWNGRYMMENNFQYSKALYHLAEANKAAFIYASSAATYGLNQVFTELPENEAPLNVYGYSKLLFDQWVRKRQAECPIQVAGLRYFNVYGPREQHKAGMASVAWHFHEQIKQTGICRLFKGSGGYTDGNQLRDFIHVDDAVAVNLWLWKHPAVSGIFNVGTGKAQTFNDVASAVIAWHKERGIESQREYIDFPEKLKNAYQSYTQADLTALRAAGFSAPFKRVESGVKHYLDWLEQTEKA